MSSPRLPPSPREPATLSFHLATLKHAGLVLCRREGRRLFYCAHYDGMRNLLLYLTEDCCGGHPEICTAALIASSRSG